MISAQHSFKRAFTIMELLIVVSIVAIFASIVVLALDSSKSKAHDTHRISELREIQRALETYYSMNAVYPQCTASDGWCGTDNGEFQAALQPLVDAGHIPEIVMDPKNVPGHRYEYYTESGLSNDTCGGTDVDHFKYVIRFATERRAIPWLEAGGYATTGNPYCLVAQKQ